MKREPQSDLRYIKTENLIQETFRSMLREMDYPQITIRELTRRAMINRKTFYLHYSSLDELLGKLSYGKKPRRLCYKKDVPLFPAK